jgi:hypothetical protein
MTFRVRRRFAAALRLVALAVLALSLLLRPVLSSIGEVHELAHDPSGQHLDISHAGQSSTHDAAGERKEGKDASTLHALLHFAHCCGQASTVPPDSPGHLQHSLPAPVIADNGALRPALARWTTPFRPPISA